MADTPKTDTDTAPESVTDLADLKSIAGDGLEVGQVGHALGRGVGVGLGGVGHQTVALFLRFIPATSRTAGWLPACGCSLPA